MTRGNKTYRPKGFETWQQALGAYYQGVQEHSKLPRFQRGRFLDKFTEIHGTSKSDIVKLYKVYRLGFIDDGPLSETIRTMFKAMDNGEWGPDQLRNRIMELVNSQEKADPEKYRSATKQIVYHLEQIDLICQKLIQPIPEEISDDEVHELAKSIWFGRQKLSTWYNRAIRRQRPTVLRGWEGQRP